MSSYLTQNLLLKVILERFFLFLSGVKKGDRVTIYMPMILETVIAMLSCSRIGATHNVVVSKSK